MILIVQKILTYITSVHLILLECYSYILWDVMTKFEHEMWDEWSFDLRMFNPKPMKIAQSQSEFPSHSLAAGAAG